MLGLRRAGRRCAGFFLLGVLTVVSLSACGPAPQATFAPDQTEASDATQTPTSDSTPTPTPLPDLVIAVEARLKSNPLTRVGRRLHRLQQRALVVLTSARSNRPRQECWRMGMREASPFN